MKEEDYQFFFSCIGIFNHYEYWTKKLWKKLKGRKHTDEAEVKCAMLHLWCHNHFGICSSPCGCGWFTLWKDIPEYGIKAITEYEDYIEGWKDIISDYQKWCEKQR